MSFARLAWLALAIPFLAAPLQARRLALVIGNDAYQQVTPLRNAVADARAVAAVLQEAGFTVTLKQDLTLQAMKQTLRGFKGQIVGGDDVVFYYSGHGVQFGGTNYLIPVDLLPQSEEQVADDAIPLQRVLDDLRDQKSRFALAIVDACRDNPFKGGGRGIGGRGLAPVTAATGQMVLYSAGAGQEALDTLGGGDQSANGVFTRVLIQEMRRPGIPAEQMVKRVRDQVVALAKGVNREQVPALYDQSLGEFYFVPGETAATTVPPTAPPSLRVQTPVELEQEYWDRIKDSTDPKDFADYGRSFPQGSHAAEAALLMRKLSTAVYSDAAAGRPPRPVSIGISPVTFNNRAIAQAPAAMFETLRDIPGIDPSLAAATSAAPVDLTIGGTVITAQPALQRNDCAAQANQIKLTCALFGKSAAAYIATVPVQIDFRIAQRFDGRLIPHLFAKTYQLGVQQQQEAQDQALLLGVHEGMLEALQSAGILDGTTDAKTKKTAYRLNAQAQRMIGDSSRTLAALEDRSSLTAGAVLSRSTGAASPGVAGETLIHTPSRRSAGGSAVVVAAGAGPLQATVFRIDTTAFPAGGLLTIDVTVAPDSRTTASFNLFPEGVPVRMQGSAPGAVAGSGELRAGARNRLSYRFPRGQVLAFGASGGRSGPAGQQGTISFVASVN